MTLKLKKNILRDLETKFQMQSIKYITKYINI